MHLPPILGPDGKKKLSKRDGDVDVLEYKAKGYLPKALMNFLAMLGWNDGTTQEIFSPQELIDRFSIDRIQKSPAVFDANRLDWMNGEYLRNKLSEDELIEEIRAFIPSEWLSDIEYFKTVLRLDRERIKRLDEAKYIMEIFFETPKIDMNMLCKKDNIETVRFWVAEVIKTIDDIQFEHDTVDESLRGLAQKLDVQVGQLFYALRVGLTGRTQAPGLFDIFVTLGKAESIKRLKSL